MAIRERITAVGAGLKSKTSKEGWLLPRQTTSFADPGTWTNIDCDVTPPERRTWSAWTMFGYWFSDALNAQNWMAPASIIALGLTWREAIVCIMFGNLVCTVPLVLNGMIGARLHIPFPIAMRASFGWYFSRFAVVVRAITALFWHAIQTYAGSTAMTQIIRSIWPSYIDIPNRIPENVGITTQGMISHLLFWLVQFPILLIPPHKLKWFFVAKCVLVTVTSVAMVITMTSKAGGAGEIWKLPYGVEGTARSWLILSSLSSITGGWATMAASIPDFTRYLKTEKGVYWQVAILPGIQLMLGLFGIICCSASKVVYGKYIWDPLEIASHWDGPAGRAGAFWVGLSWVVAQIGTNLSANVISCANDIMCLFPKYINIKRGVAITTITAAWVMQPWKIIHSAQSLLAFMSGLGIFLAPIAAMLSADYWVTHRQKLDVPGLYRAQGRYRYNKWGTNWRALLAFLVSVVPTIPGMFRLLTMEKLRAASVDPSITPKIGNANKLYFMFYFWGYTSAFLVYITLSHFFPVPETHVPATIHGDIDFISAAEDESRNSELGEENKGRGVVVQKFAV
ncbi:allantoin permease [Cladorrhinum samala]|uniref:Allantoin permease n=1 Tax=Cladorrhinum samala TaxID=585594 RepID=A0AAV9HKA2_9PEZI|nr:allantoin permease [Cladorrhinum samala]